MINVKVDCYGSPFDILLRMSLAVGGGYFISLWVVILLTPLLPGERHTQVLTAVEIVFLVYLLVFIWAFARVSLKKLSTEFIATFLITGATVWITHGSLA